MRVDKCRCDICGAENKPPVYNYEMSLGQFIATKFDPRSNRNHACEWDCLTKAMNRALNPTGSQMVVRKQGQAA